ncbi:hypothetical protein EV363DRAFT_216594 [Boletus edulis]|nr:hypothetical protein EV363DRAFT_216594 [Boletus edulis]
MLVVVAWSDDLVLVDSDLLVSDDDNLTRVQHSLRDPDLLLPTIISGLTVYFDRSLGANLPYRFERLQYAEIRKTYVTGPTVKVG